MRTTVEIDTENPGEMKQILGLSLESTDTVEYTIDATDKLEVQVETKGLGALRGCTDTVFRLASLAEKF